LCGLRSVATHLLYQFRPACQFPADPDSAVPVRFRGRSLQHFYFTRSAPIRKIELFRRHQNMRARRIESA
ncbi:hypothetical protein AB0L06_25170, partial [Spirillospora sp. NPDC052269]